MYRKRDSWKYICLHRYLYYRYKLQEIQNNIVCIILTAFRGFSILFLLGTFPFCSYFTIFQPTARFHFSCCRLPCKSDCQRWIRRTQSCDVLLHALNLIPAQLLIKRLPRYLSNILYLSVYARMEIISIWNFERITKKLFL